jgi:hypothetical protein
MRSKPGAGVAERYAWSTARQSGCRTLRPIKRTILKRHHCRRSQNDDTLNMLFVLITQQRMGNRPGRIEPRAVKRRPKPYPFLTKPRPLARENVREHGHPKKIK